jgi:tRNA pseudouridine(55) synthase
MQYLDEALKIYLADVVLGAQTDTGDLTGATVATGSDQVPAPDLVAAALSTMLGPQLQAPPQYSAIKVEGRPLYSYARAGEVVEVQPRPITVHSLDVVETGPSRIQVRIACTRGTYARVIGEDLAVRLGTVGHLGALRREQSGSFTLAHAIAPDALADIVAVEPGLGWERVLGGRRDHRAPRRSLGEIREAVAPHIVSASQALSHLPALEVDATTRARTLNGQSPGAHPDGIGVGDRFRIVAGAELVAVAELTVKGPRLLLVHGEGDEHAERR